MILFNHWPQSSVALNITSILQVDKISKPLQTSEPASEGTGQASEPMFFATYIDRKSSCWPHLTPHSWMIFFFLISLGPLFVIICKLATTIFLSQDVMHN